MSIEELMFISTMLFIVSVCFLAVAVVMFFKFDVRHIYRILKADSNCVPARNREKATAVPPNKNIEAVVEPNALLSEREKTQRYGDTVPLDTIKFMLLQDITYTHDDFD